MRLDGRRMRLFVPSRPALLAAAQIDSAQSQALVSLPVEQATDGPRKGFNPPPALR
jgi:hypothetical protein